MKNRTMMIGLALLLLGNIFAIPDAVFFYIGLVFGIVGLILVVLGSKSNE